MSGAPDYTRMSGAEFQRAVGADPEKWAAAFIQAYPPAEAATMEAERLDYIATWFADAMDAAVKADGADRPE